MTQPILYLFVGYPGSGKTTVARIIAQATGGVHLWADEERQLLFGKPDLSPQQLATFYDKLNKRTATLLANGMTVVFDTNFNYRKDRARLREIADDQGARTVIIWMTTPVEIARIRAVEDAAGKNNRVWGNMSIDDFQKLSDKLEAPTDDEEAIEINGATIDPEYIKQQLGL